MATTTHKNISLNLTKAEIEYLCSAGFLTSQQIDVLRQIKCSDNSSISLAIDVAEEFRDKFTEQLAKAGFDEKHEVTTEGKILEDLIDRFYTA